jgi:hypothetical protein
MSSDGMGWDEMGWDGIAHSTGESCSLGTSRSWSVKYERLLVPSW